MFSDIKIKLTKVNQRVNLVSNVRFHQRKLILISVQLILHHFLIFNTKKKMKSKLNRD